MVENKEDTTSNSESSPIKIKQTKPASKVTIKIKGPNSIKKANDSAVP